MTDIRNFALNSYFIAVMIALSVLVGSFIVDLILCLTVKSLRKKRGWFFMSIVFSLLVLTAYSFLTAESIEEGVFYPILCFAVGLLLYIPIYLLSENKEVIKEKEEVERYYSPFLENNAFINKLRRGEDKRVDKIVASTPSIPEKVDDLDFSHVKNVIERMNYYQLTAPDRKTVNDLKVLVLAAESGEELPDLKEKINDGLGALLKIMSKYRV